MNAAELLLAIEQRFPDAVAATHMYRGDATAIVRRPFLLDVARLLKEDPRFRMNFLMDLSAVDFLTFGKERPSASFAPSGVAVQPPAEIPDRDPWPGPPGSARFIVLYHFFSASLRHRLRLEVPVDDADPEVDSLSALWAGANWLEREVWDMFGIRFRGHPNLKRILMYDEFVGHPLRKDYPVKKRQPLIGPIN